MSRRPADAFTVLDSAARNPDGYIRRWKGTHPGKVIGLFPMNFPAELVAAGGALPVVIQDRPDPITAGNNLLAEFYCGYTRSIADQAARNQLGLYDGFMNADHCIQLLGAVDVVREEEKQKPVFFEHLIAAMDDPWSRAQVRSKIDSFVAELERFTGNPLGDAELRRAIRAFNRNRELLRAIFSERRCGSAAFTPRELQILVQSSMVMDKDEHSNLLCEVTAERAATGRPDDRIRLHLSGHFCHAPKAGLFDLFEECGAMIVDDDLYHGVRYVSTDVGEDKPPREAIVDWYFDRNERIPCPTRVQKTVHWDRYLRDSIAASGAEGVIVLMAKFCEAHMFYYPELRKALDAWGIPHLLLETEHEGIPIETFRTRVEALLEGIRRNKRGRAAGEIRASESTRPHREH